MTIRVVADTHALLWYLQADPRLSVAPKAILSATEAAGDQIAISIITLAEMVYLIDRGRIHAATMVQVAVLLDRQSATWVAIPVERGVVTAMARIPRAEVPDLPDRLIAATALMLNVPVVSRDRKIRSSLVPSIW
jgi:PIN domain nuclease of toxin-antitoxin system